MHPNVLTEFFCQVLKQIYLILARRWSGATRTFELVIKVIGNYIPRDIQRMKSRIHLGSTG
jgi:hypothetical protein